ncbi:MAG: PQQ-binding-like beta-propeller repeat protein [Chthoniobacterales bacterium]
MDEEGDLKWKFDAHDKVASSPAIDASGSILFTSNNDVLWRIDAAGNLQQQLPLEGVARGSPVIARDGTVYVHGDDVLIALRGVAGPASGIWPMKRHDPKGTGRAGGE